MGYNILRDMVKALKPNFRLLSATWSTAWVTLVAMLTIYFFIFLVVSYCFGPYLRGVRVTCVEGLATQKSKGFSMNQNSEISEMVNTVLSDQTLKSRSPQSQLPLTMLGEGVGTSGFETGVGTGVEPGIEPGVNQGFGRKAVPKVFTPIGVGLEYFSSNSKLLSDSVASLEYSEELPLVYHKNRVELNSVCLNSAELYEILLIPGIGYEAASIIIENRPYSSLDDLYKLQELNSLGAYGGIKKENLDKAIPYFKNSF
jgi:hypothetical protein